MGIVVSTPAIQALKVQGLVKESLGLPSSKLGVTLPIYTFSIGG